MRKLLSSLAALAILAPVAAQAQTGTVAVTASVATYADITEGRALAFGALSRTVDNTVSATTAASNGYAVVHYNYAANVSASLTTAPTSGTAVLPMTLTCSKSTDNATYTAAANCAAIATLTAPTTVAALPTYYVGFGGTITAANVAQAPTGSYTGTITVTLAP